MNTTEIKKLIQQELPNILQTDKTFHLGLLSEIREALFESTLPVTVDVVDLSQTNEQFKQKVLSEAILWKD